MILPARFTGEFNESPALVKRREADFEPEKDLVTDGLKFTFKNCSTQSSKFGVFIINWPGEASVGISIVEVKPK